MAYKDIDAVMAAQTDLIDIVHTLRQVVCEKGGVGSNIPAPSLDFGFNPKIEKRLVFELATAHFVARHEDVLFLGRPGTGKSHLAQAIAHAVIAQGYAVLYREAHVLLEEIVDATIHGTRKDCMDALATAPLLVIDDIGMRKLPASARRGSPRTRDAEV